MFYFDGFRVCQQILKDEGKDKQNASKHQWRHWWLWWWYPVNWRTKFPLAVLASAKCIFFFFSHFYPVLGFEKDKSKYFGKIFLGIILNLHSPPRKDLYILWFKTKLILYISIILCLVFSKMKWKYTWFWNFI